jgi:hypothetical protein
LISLLFGCSVDEPFNQPGNRLGDWLIGWQIIQPPRQSIDWLVACLVGFSWFVGWMVGWFVRSLAHQPSNYLDSWMVG